MTDTEEYSGDACVVLPKNYLDSAEAVAEIYEDELAEAAGSLDVDVLSRGPGFFQGTLLVPLIWAVSAIWTVCH